MPNETQQNGKIIVRIGLVVASLLVAALAFCVDPKKPADGFFLISSICGISVCAMSKKGRANLVRLGHLLLELLALLTVTLGFGMMIVIGAMFVRTAITMIIK